MANLQYGDKIKFQSPPHKLNKVVDVVPIKFDIFEEDWVVVAQQDATHMLITIDISGKIGLQKIEYIMIEIGECENLYLLADAIVD